MMALQNIRLVLNEIAGPITRAQWALYVTFAVFGIASAFLIPYGAGFDEEQHMRRSWEMAHLELIPNARLGPGLPIPALFKQASYRERLIIRTIEAEYWEKYRDVSLGDLGWIYDDAQTRSFYSPLLLAPQSFAVRYLSLKFELPALQVIWGARLMGLASYLVLIFLALRLIPFGRWILLVFATTPTALFQASTVTADSMTNGIGLLFVAGTLSLGRRSKTSTREVMWLLLLCGLLFNSKLNLLPLILLPILIFTPPRLRGRHYLFLLFSIAVLLFVFVGGWYLLAYPESTRVLGDAKLLRQAEFVFSNPGSYFSSILLDLFSRIPEAIASSVAAFGYYYWRVPALIYPVFALAVVTALYVDSRGRAPDAHMSRAMLILFGTVFLFTTFGLQLIVEPVGSAQVQELHGRYLTAILPLPILALLGSHRLRRFSVSEWMPGACGSGAVMLFVVGMGLSYHVTCGTAFYSLSHCYHPQYKNWAPSSMMTDPVTNERPLRQEFVAECNALARVRVWVDGSSSAPEARTTFSIGTRDDQSIKSFSVENSSLPVDDWMMLDFEAVPNSSGEAYWLDVSLDAEAGEDGPRLGMTARPEYKRGRLLIGGTESKRDLFFQYGCTAGLKRVLSRIIP